MSKVSNMTAEEARNIVSEVYGHRGQTKAAADIRRGEVTVSRWLTGITPIDTMSALLLRLILLLHRREVAWRKWMGEYEEPDGDHIGMDDII